MSSLYELETNQQWQVAITHIQSLADGDAAYQLFNQNDDGWSAIMIACLNDAPQELYQLMITKAKLDSRKRCLPTVTINNGFTALHCAAWLHSACRCRALDPRAPAGAKRNH